MEELTIEQWMEKYDYLKRMSEYTIFTTKEDIETLHQGPKINVDGTNVSIEFLNRILNDDTYYDYALRYVTNEINYFSVNYIIGGDTSGTTSYKRSEIVNGIDLLIKTNQIVLNEETQKRYERLKSELSFERFIEKHKGNNYNVKIEGINYSFPIEQLISLMQIPDEQFDLICSNPEQQNINGIPKEHFIYATYKFFKQENVMAEYQVPENIKKRYKEIGTLQKIDLQAINKHLETTDTKHKTITIDEQLHTAIISGMPEEASDLEKAMYIYIKMCKLLTYDDEYFAVNQRGPATLKHKEAEYVSTITLENNKVVCFEFNLIYSKLLNELGINFSSNYKNMIGEAYGEGHASLEFRTKKFLVSADSVTSILHGDIMQAKLNQPISGLKCLNRNQETQQEFQTSLSKIYQLVAQQEINTQELPPVEHIQTFEEIIEEYKQTTQNIKEIPLTERLMILVQKVNQTRMKGIDSLSYVLQLRKVLFTEEQRKNNMGVTVLRNNQPTDENRIAMASAIITLNPRNFDEHPELSHYYYYQPNSELVELTKEELQERMNSGLLEYIEKDDPRIPGIDEGGGLKK